MTYGEVRLPHRVVRQPPLHLYAGGDCGPCVLSGLTGLSLEAIYARRRNGQVDGFTWNTMREFLWDGSDLFDRFIDKIPIWPSYDSVMVFGLPSGLMALAWFNYVRMAIDAGYYGLAGVSHARAGQAGSPDHWVLICGARVLPPAEGSSAIREELLISDSSTAEAPEMWVDVHEFLEKWGGYNALLARPAEVSR